MTLLLPGSMVRRDFLVGKTLLAVAKREVVGAKTGWFDHAVILAFARCRGRGLSGCGLCWRTQRDSRSMRLDKPEPTVRAYTDFYMRDPGCACQ